MTGQDKTMAPEKELILKLFAQTATKNVKFRSSRAVIVRYIAGNVFQSTRKVIPLTQTEIRGSKKEVFPGSAVLIKGMLKTAKSPIKKRDHFFSTRKKHKN